MCIRPAIEVGKQGGELGMYLLACSWTETAVSTVNLFSVANLVPNLPEKHCGWLLAVDAKVVTSTDDFLLLSVIDMGR